MNFSDALHYAKAGRPVARALWTPGAYIAVRASLGRVSPYVVLYTPHGDVCDYAPPDQDLFAEDWQIVRDPALSGGPVDLADRIGVTGAPEFEPLSQVHKDDPRAYARPDFDLDKARLDSITGGVHSKELERAKAEAEKARLTSPAVEIAHAFEDLRDKLSRIYSPSVIHPAGLENLEVRLQEAEFWANRCAEQVSAAAPIDAAERSYRYARGLR